MLLCVAVRWVVALLLGAVLGAGTLAWLTNYIGPHAVYVGQDVIVSSDSALLVDDPSTLSSILHDANAGATINGLSLISTYGVLPIEEPKGTRLHVIDKRFDMNGAIVLVQLSDTPLLRSWTASAWLSAAPEQSK